MSNNHFTLTPANDRNVSHRINAAYTAAGTKAPSVFATTLKRHLRTIPDAQQVAATIAAEAYNTAPNTDVHDFWDSAVDQMIHAQGADALKHALVSALDTQERASGTRQVRRALEDLHPWAARQAAALTKAAKELPAGNAALDPEAVLAADKGKALTTARHALQALALYASLPDTATRYAKTLGYYAHIIAVVDPGKPTIEAVNVLGRTLNNTKLDNTHALRNLARDMKTNPDLALIGVARGNYPGITLDPADTHATLTARAQRAGDGFTRRTATETEQRHLVAMK